MWIAWYYYSTFASNLETYISTEKPIAWRCISGMLASLKRVWLWVSIGIFCISFTGALSRKKAAKKPPLHSFQKQGDASWNSIFRPCKTGNGYPLLNFLWSDVSCSCLSFFPSPVKSATIHLLPSLSVWFISYSNFYEKTFSAFNKSKQKMNIFFLPNQLKYNLVIKNTHSNSN